MEGQEHFFPQDSETLRKKVTGGQWGGDDDGDDVESGGYVMDNN